MQIGWIVNEGGPWRGELRKSELDQNMLHNTYKLIRIKKN